MFASIKAFVSSALQSVLIFVASLLGKISKKVIALSDAKQILVVRLDGIGDIALMTPFLRELRRNCPDAEITLVVVEKFKNLVEFCPYVNHVYGLNSNFSGWFRQIHLFRESLRLRRQCFPKKGFDWAINPRVGSAVNGELYLSCLSRASNLVVYRSCLTIDMQMPIRGASSFFSHVLEFEMGTRHEVWGSLGILEYFDLSVTNSVLELWPSEADLKFAGKRVQSPRFIAVGSHVSFGRRCWPVECYAQLLNTLKKQSDDIEFVLIGAVQDKEKCDELIRLTGSFVISLAGEVSLRETCAVLKRAVLYVGNDSGPMHLAVGMGIPVVEISCHPEGGSREHVNAPERFGPQGVPCSVCRPQQPLFPCINCCSRQDSHCIQQVKVGDVVNAVQGLIEGR